MLVCVPNSGMSHPTSFIAMCAYIRHADCTLAEAIDRSCTELNKEIIIL